MRKEKLFHHHKNDYNLRSIRNMIEKEVEVPRNIKKIDINEVEVTQDIKNLKSMINIREDLDHVLISKFSLLSQWYIVILKGTRVKNKKK